MASLGGYNGADWILRSGFDFPADPSIVMLGGALARFVLRGFVERVLGVRFPGVPGFVAFEEEEVREVCWFRRSSMRASCCALMASASNNCFRESGSVVARGGRPGDKIARPIFLLAEDRSIGAGRRRSSPAEWFNAVDDGEVGSSLTLLHKSVSYFVR